MISAKASQVETLFLCRSIAGNATETLGMHSSARVTRPLAFRVETWWACKAKAAVVSSMSLHMGVDRSQQVITAPLSVWMKSERVLLTGQMCWCSQEMKCKSRPNNKPRAHQKLARICSLDSLEVIERMTCFGETYRAGATCQSEG